MARKILVLVPILLTGGLLTGCSGSGNTPPPTLTVTTVSLPSGQTTVSYGASLAATGGTAPYSWNVVSGSLPAGLILSAGGAIEGTPTTSGVSTFTAKVLDSAQSPQSATAQFSLAVSGGTLKITSVNAATGTAGSAYQFQMRAAGGAPPYAWSLPSGSQLPAGLTMSSSGAIGGTPTASGFFSPSLEVTDATTNNTASQNINFPINPAGQPPPDGSYVFEFGGNAPSGNPVEVNGTFQLQNGAVSTGLYNENILNQPSGMASQTITGGSISLPPNGLGQMELNLQNGGAVTFAIAFGNLQGPIIEFDDATGKGMRGSGYLAIGNPAIYLSTIKGRYAFGLNGFDTHSQPTALAGSFEADGNGGISSGEVDVNDSGVMTYYMSVTGSYTVNGSGGGTITLNLEPGDTVTYAVYFPSSSEMFAISADATSTTIPLVGGYILQQTGSMSDAALKGVDVMMLSGFATNNDISIPDVAAGLITSDGAGNLTASYDEYKGQLLSGQSYSATYSVASPTGRVTVTAAGVSPSPPMPVLYLVSSFEAFVLGTDGSASSGTLEWQSGAPFSEASVKGYYRDGSVPFSQTNTVAIAQANGAGGIQYIYSASGPNGLSVNQTLSGTYTVDATGRVVVAVSGDANPRILYIAGPGKAVYLSGEGGGYVADFTW